MLAAAGWLAWTAVGGGGDWPGGEYRIVYDAYHPDDNPEGGVWVLDADGSNHRPLSEEGWDPRWSPDGSRVAFYGPDGTGIWVTDAATGQSRRLTDEGWGPVWSPDGRRIAYHSSLAPDGDGIWLMDADGENLR